MKINREKNLKWLFAFGLILICVGFILMSTSILGQEKNILGLVASARDEWSVSGNLEKGDKIALIFREGNDWWQGYFDPVDGTPILAVYINIFDPNNNATEFEVELTPMQPGYPVLVILNISVIKNDGLDTSSVRDENTGMIKEIGGTVQYNGIYRAEVAKTYPPRESPPRQLQLRREKTKTEYPYTFLLPGGAIIGVVGATITLFGLKSRKRRPSIKRKKSRISPKRTFQLDARTFDAHIVLPQNVGTH